MVEGAPPQHRTAPPRQADLDAKNGAVIAPSRAHGNKEPWPIGLRHPYPTTSLQQTNSQQPTTSR